MLTSSIAAQPVPPPTVAQRKRQIFAQLRTPSSHIRLCPEFPLTSFKLVAAGVTSCRLRALLVLVVVMTSVRGLGQLGSYYDSRIGTTWNAFNGNH
ncbi:hypothetical protein Csa_002910 [Cucumis sativus]|uniref:Uncharacterized protein n=1 Tax=Cucumis sativus TaxID=3659 RepID=A0A0A0KF55_CUCSA|nr:hypothetical protein Csa_002910 [Cucumis sativus]